MSTAAEYNRKGVLAKQKQEFAAAAACYEQAISLEPSFAEAHFNLGILRRSLGRVQEAVACFSAALSLRPDVLVVRLQYANCLAELGQVEDALKSLCQVAEANADSPEYCFALGNLYFKQQAWGQARQWYEAALRLKSEWAEPLVNLANVHRELDQPDVAETLYQRAIEQEPTCTAALTNLGQLRRARGDFSAALDLGLRAVAANPGAFEPWLNLGNLQAELARLEEATDSYQTAIRLRPQSSAAYTYLGDTLARLERIDEARQCYERALQFDSTDPRPATGLGNLCCKTGDQSAAQPFYELAANLAPTDPLRQLRAATCCPLVFASESAMETYRHDLLQTASRHANARLSTSTAFVAPTFPESPFFLQFLAGNLRPLKAAIANVYAWYFSKGPGNSLTKDSSRSRVRTTRPRLGFVVTNSHEVGFIRSVGSVVTHLSKVGFEVLVVCSQLRAQVIREAFEGTQVEAVPIPERFDLAAKAIAELQLDLIYHWEVGTDPTNYFLPFLRLAPVQCTSAGVQVTTGISEVDFYLSSKPVEVKAAQQHYSEELVLAESLVIRPVPQSKQLPLRSRHQFGLSDSANLYGCLQNLGKFHPQFDWPLGEILRGDPEGQLVLVSDLHRTAASALSRRFQQTIPEVAERIVFVPALENQDYLSLLQLCDVILDPIHFGGVNTTLDAIALNKPVVTRPTEQHRGRYTAAYLRELGLPELIAADIQEYATIAVDLGTSVRRRSELTAQIDERKQQIRSDQSACTEHERIFHELLGRFR